MHTTKQAVNSMIRRLGILMLPLLLGAVEARAVTGYWTNDTTGTLNWQQTNRWADGVVPNAAGDVAYITNNITAARSVNITGTVTIGTIYVGDADGSHAFTISGSGTGVFDNAGSTAGLTMTATSTNLLFNTGRLQLISDLAIDNLSVTSLLTLSSIIEGTGAVAVAGGPGLLLNASNSFSGGITLDSGLLRMGHNACLGKGPMTVNGGTLDVSGTRTTSNNNPHI